LKKFFDFKKNRPWAEDATIIMQLGLTMAGSILFCFWVGRKLDGWLSTRGVFTAVFTILGVVGGGVVAYRQIMEITEGGQEQDQDKDENGEDHGQSP